MILAHDLGTTGNKATLLDHDGNLLGSTAVAYSVDFGSHGRAEQDPEHWWDAVCRATRSLLASTGRAAEEVEAVTFSGQMMGAVLIDATGRPVRPAIIWADTRSLEQCRAITAVVGMEHAYELTGHRLNPTYTLSKLAWVREHEPENFARTTKVLQAKDYVGHRLTGQMATDPSDASGTNAYDQRAGRWSEELLDAAGLPASLFPDIVPSTTVLGVVTREASAASGLLTGTPVVVGGGDGPMAALGAGIIDSADGAYAYLGSSSWVSVSAGAPVLDPLMRSMTFTHVVPDRFVPTATMQAGGASLQWITGVLASGSGDRYGDLLAQAADTAAAEDGLFFLPHLLGERSPYWNPRARAAFVGLQMHHGRAEMTRAVLEGIAFNLYTGLRAFTEAGIQVHAVDAIGGAARSGLLLDIFASAWGVPVAARDLVDEATSLGAAVVGGVGVGIFPDFAVARTLSQRAPYQQPTKEHAEAYALRYVQFMDAYRVLEPWFDELGT